MASSADEAADLFEGDDPFLVELLQLLATLVELDLLLEELPVALLEHVRALVELLVAGVQPPLVVRELGAPLAGVVLRLALEADLLFLGLEDQVLLLGSSVGDDARGLLGGGLDRLVRPLAAGDESQPEANGDADQRPKGEAGAFHLHPPIRPRDRSDALSSKGPARTCDGAERAIA